MFLQGLASDDVSSLHSATQLLTTSKVMKVAF